MLIPLHPPQGIGDPPVPEPQSIGVLGPYFVTRPQHALLVGALVSYLVVHPEQAEDIWATLGTFVVDDVVSAMRERWDSLVAEESDEPA